MCGFHTLSDFLLEYILYFTISDLEKVMMDSSDGIEIDLG